MPPEYGYMEGDHLGKPYDLGLWVRLSRYARPYVSWIVAAAGLILLGAGAELLMPYLTRVAIDRYIVGQALEIRLDKLPSDMATELRTQAGDTLLPLSTGAGIMQEADFRKLDPRLAARVRQKGGVGGTPYYMAPEHEISAELAGRHPGLFVRSGHRLFISTSDLKKLSPDELYDLRWPDVAGLFILAAVYLAAAGLAYGFGYAQRVILEKTGQEMMFTMRQELWMHLLSRALSFFSQRPVGKLVTRLTNDIANLNEMYRNAMVGFCQDFFFLIGIMVMLLWLDWELALVCLSLAPVIGFIAWYFSRMARDAFRALQGHLGRINARLSETLSGLMVVKLYRAEKEGAREFKRLNEAYHEAGMRQIKVFTLFFPITDLLAALAVGLIIWYGGGQVVQDRLSLGTLVAFLLYMQMFFRPVRDMAEKFNILQSAMASAERIFHLLDDQDALPVDPDAREQCPGPGQVSFERVSFGYEPGKDVLHEVSFSIPAGQTWAVVGPTGAGKTSLMGLLTRLYDCGSGRVLIDGMDVKRLSPVCLARKVSMVSQEVFLFAGSVNENITLGREYITGRMLNSALAVSGAADFVERLDKGLETPLGEGGMSLSAGQRQLLSLARALAGEPDILVLDEATSSVDPESEKLMQEALPKVMAGRTALVVAHRLSTVRNADNILVMKDGRIAEQGRHDELVIKGGIYARLVELQQIKDKLEGRNGYGA